MSEHASISLCNKPPIYLVRKESKSNLRFMRESNKLIATRCQNFASRCFSCDSAQKQQNIRYASRNEK